MRKILPIGAAILCGLAMLVDFFVAHPLVDRIGAMLIEGVTILAAFALLLGLLVLLATHARRLKRGSQPGLSVVLIVALLGTLAVGLLLPGSTTLTWIFDYVYYPLQSTMVALLAFFAVSAAYRAFRLRTAHAWILLVVSLFLFLTQLPQAAQLSPYMPMARDWLLSVPVTAGMRGILLGTALGTIATALRILLAVDHPYA
jgi:hypothetical protein